MLFDPHIHTTQSLPLGNGCLTYRAYLNIPYVEHPVAPALQVLNIFIPQTYVEGGSINGYTARTAPIFFPNGIGGYKEALPKIPAVKDDGTLNAEAAALAHGYVVISPGARGKATYDGSRYTGKAPACIVDLKAAVRFVRSIAGSICGDVNRIISNGTSAGGAMSALLAASGDDPRYLPYLQALGAADTSDRIHAASCYCPITNLDHADAAYEWQFGHVAIQHQRRWNEIDGRRVATIVETSLTAEQLAHADALKAQFPAYVNSLNLPGASMNPDGSGELQAYVEAQLLASAARAKGDIPAQSGIDPAAGVIDFRRYCTWITRMKPPFAFDQPDLSATENELFGSEDTDRRHFTAYAAQVGEGSSAPDENITLMNAMHFTGHAGCAQHWRIRHGAADRDTSFAISALLVKSLVQHGRQVDYHLPWGVPHSGDYDLQELFAWIDSIAR